MSFDNFYKRKVEGGEAVTPFDFNEMPTQKPAAEELKQDGQKSQQRTDWWQVPTYTQAVEAQRKAAMEGAEKDVNRAKRERNAAIITDMADILTRFFATRGADGAWMVPQMQNRALSANDAYNNALRRKDGLVVDYGGRIAQAKVQDYQSKQKQRLADREYVLAVDKAKREERQQRANLMLKQAELALSKAKMEAEKEQRELDNQLKRGKISEQNYVTERARIQAKYADVYQKSLIDKNQGEYIVYDKDGNVYRNRTRDAAEYNAMQLGTWEPNERTYIEEREQGQPYGEPIKTTTKTTKVVGGYSEKPKKESKTMPGVKDDKKTMPGVK